LIDEGYNKLSAAQQYIKEKTVPLRCVILSIASC